MSFKTDKLLAIIFLRPSYLFLSRVLFKFNNVKFTIWVIAFRPGVGYDNIKDKNRNWEKI